MFSIRSKKRDQLVEFLKNKGISTSVVWMPVPMHPLYKKYKSSIPVAKKVWKELITLPLFSDISNKEINYISKSLREFDKTITNFKK